jgi:general stress protein 26
MIGAMMREPATKLDERFSDPGTAATSWSAAREVLEAAQLSWVSTVRADGRPHVTPLVAVWLDETLYFSTGPAEQKALNIASHPHVVITTGCNSWNQGLDVMVEGEARRVIDRPTLERLAAAWRSKWDGSWQFEPTDEGFRQPLGGTAYVFAVEPTKVLAFGRQPQSGDGMLETVSFTHTRYRP